MDADELAVEVEERSTRVALVDHAVAAQEGAPPMSLLFPLGMAALGALVPLVVLYILKQRREEYRVPANFLWAQALEDLTRAPAQAGGREAMRRLLHTAKGGADIAVLPLPEMVVAGRADAVAFASLVNVPLVMPSFWLGCELVTKGAGYSWP